MNTYTKHLNSVSFHQECDSDDYPLVLVHRDSPSVGSRTNEGLSDDESVNEATTPL